MGRVFPNWMQLKTPRICFQDQLLLSCPSNNISWFSFIHSLQKSCLVCQITLNIPYLKYPLNGVGYGLPMGSGLPTIPKQLLRTAFHFRTLPIIPTASSCVIICPWKSLTTLLFLAARALIWFAWWVGSDDTGRWTSTLRTLWNTGCPSSQSLLQVTIH